MVLSADNTPNIALLCCILLVLCTPRDILLSELEPILFQLFTGVVTSKGLLLCPYPGSKAPVTSPEKVNV